MCFVLVSLTQAILWSTSKCFSRLLGMGSASLETLASRTPFGMLLHSVVWPLTGQWRNIKHKVYKLPSNNILCDFMFPYKCLAQLIICMLKSMTSCSWCPLVLKSSPRDPWLCNLLCKLSAELRGKTNPGQNAAHGVTLEIICSGDWFTFKTPERLFSWWPSFVDSAAYFMIAVKGEPQMLSDPFRWLMGF